MGLITFFLLGAFTLLYISKSISKKPEYVTKAVRLIEDNMKYLAIGGVIYGLLAAFLTPIVQEYAPLEMFVRMFANIMIAIMALPHCFDRIIEKHREKVNAAILQETRGLIGWITDKSQIVGFVGAGALVLLFVVLFG